VLLFQMLEILTDAQKKATRKSGEKAPSCGGVWSIVRHINTPPEVIVDGFVRIKSYLGDALTQLPFALFVANTPAYLVALFLGPSASYPFLRRGAVDISRTRSDPRPSRLSRTFGPPSSSTPASLQYSPLSYCLGTWRAGDE
jgi:hypothetical protein